MVTHLSGNPIINRPDERMSGGCLGKPDKATLLTHMYSPTDQVPGTQRQGDAHTLTHDAPTLALHYPFLETAKGACHKSACPILLT